MRPVLFRLGELNVYAFGTFVLLALGVGFAVMLLAGWRLRYPLPASVALACVVPVPLLAAARVGSILDHPDALELSVSGVLRGGLMLTPALVAAAIPVALLGRLMKQSAGASLDVFVISMAAGLTVGKTGCFLAGCCFGTPTTLPWGVDFSAGGLVPAQLRGVPLHPSQLYLVVWLGLIALGLTWRARSRRFEGELFLAGLAAYCLFKVVEPAFLFSSAPRSGWAWGGWSVTFLLSLHRLVLLWSRASAPSSAPAS